jgi:glutamate-1-semialdehyde aminotransferase
LNIPFFLASLPYQAGLRTKGTLSFMDAKVCATNPNCGEECKAHCQMAPDFETFSKALNGGQFPLSVLAGNKELKDAYRRGLYGNTSR